MAKCQFFCQKAEFLGLKVTAGGVAPLPKQLATVRDFPQPGTIKEVQGFLGVVNFYSCFIPATASGAERRQKRPRTANRVSTHGDGLQPDQSGPHEVNVPGFS